MRRRLASRLPLAALAVRVASGNRLADLAVALPHAATAVLAIAKMRHVELRQRDADQVVPLPADHFAVGHIFPQVLAYFPADDLFEPRRVAVDLHDHEAMALGRARTCKARAKKRRLPLPSPSWQP